MRISFDLDDTLFVSPQIMSTETELSFPLNRIFQERLRYGTIECFQQIRAREAEIWIYTISFRSEWYIRNLFRCYGLKLDGIVNGARHAKEVQGHRTEILPSKCPNHYRIHLHVDDERSVAQNGAMDGFTVFLIGAWDAAWVQKLLTTIDTLTKHIK